MAMEEQPMTTIAIVPEVIQPTGKTYRAIAGDHQSVGRTAGEALDALTSQLSEDEAGTLLVVQHLRPDRFFTAQQQQRLEELMQRWRAARDSQAVLPPEEQAELESLVEAELQGAMQRAAALVQGLAP
jgi:hypothetical protein